MRFLDLIQEETGPLWCDEALDPVTVIVSRGLTGEGLGYSHGIVVLAYMIWPEDELQRRNWIEAHKKFGLRVGDGERARLCWSFRNDKSFARA